MSESQLVAVRSPIAAEDQARGNFYALLGRLYAAAPDAALLRAIATADELPAAVGEGPGRDKLLSPVRRVFPLLEARMRHRAISTPCPVGVTSNCSIVT